MPKHGEGSLIWWSSDHTSSHRDVLVFAVVFCHQPVKVAAVLLLPDQKTPLGVRVLFSVFPRPREAQEILGSLVH